MRNKFLISKTLLFIIVIFGILNVVTINAATQSSYCNPEIQIVNQDPNPAVPEGYVKVVIEVSSLQSCNGFAVALKPEYPFSVDPGIDTINTIASSPNAANYKSVWDIPYKIRVANDAIEGDYDLKLLYHEGNSRDFNTNFVVKDLNLSIVDSQTDFDAVFQAASSGQVSLGIVNTGKNTANSLVVSIPQQDNFRVSGATDQIIGNLAAGDYTIVSFGLSPSRMRNNTGNGAGSYTGGTDNQAGQGFNQQSQVLKVRLDYTDGIGKRRSVIKEIQFGNSFFQNGNSTGFTGTFSRNGSRTNTTNSSSLLSSWYFYVIIAIVLIIGYMFYRKSDSIKGFFNKGVEKKSSHTPDWVTSEKSNKKK